jgi:cytochrome b subunit of formate dehydrogenase/mono/diheme cytochrome c family protein
MATVAHKMPSDIAHGQYSRFDVLQRIEHIVLLVSFTLLGITGLIQKFAAWPISDATIKFLGGIETTRLIHHVNAALMIILTAYHIIEVGYRVFVLRARMSMLPGLSDVTEWWDDTRYKLGLVKQPAKFGRYNYGEKMEYWALIWGTVVMGVTGFMLWNPITTAKLVPGEWIPAAKAAHGAEAILAVLAIILWHFYNVHVKLFNKSMFTGKMDEHQMAHEHGRELEAIARGTAGRKIDPPVLRRRQTLYLPLAIVLMGVMGYGIYGFLTIENTAPFTTVPAAVNVPILLTATPQPTPTRAPTAVPTAAPTQAPTAGGAVAFAEVQTILKAKCGTCHGDAATAGLNVTTYAALMKGGASGPVISAKDADGSALIKKIAGGSHPGQFTADELATIKAWIAAGAAEGGAPAPAPAAGNGKVTFVKDIQPVFAAKCAACHGTLGGLTLTSYESVMHGGTSGPAVTPGDPDKSSLIKKQTTGGHPGQLAPEEIDLVRKWITSGAAEQ